jgi:hypothetical protein
MELTSIPVNSWTTRQEAEEFCENVAAAIPGARVERYPSSRQVRTTDGQIPIYFKRAALDDIRHWPHVKGLYQRCK